jgi:predicted dinucleotide-binding enzyme/DMSO/TMAO reductase YedYZ heme-binding membrane subunit
MMSGKSIELSAFKTANPSSVKQTIAIIGTGSFGIAIGRRLLAYGYDIVYGSRNPNINYLRECFGDDVTNTQTGRFSVTSVFEAWNSANLFVFFAISAHESVYEKTVAEIVEALDERIINQSKVVIEVSNLSDEQTIDSIRVSNAMRLQSAFLKMLDHYQKFYRITVVKAFNLMSANSITSPLDPVYDKETLTNSYDKFVPVVGDDEQAKSQVIELCERIGFKAFDYGSLTESAVKLEVANRTTFSNWYYANLISVLSYLFNLIWMFANAFYFPSKPHTFSQYLSKVSVLNLLNKTTGFTALQLLAYVYLAYVVASFYQLAYSTKYKRYPRYLDTWLRIRKQLGLWSFAFATIHVFTAMFMINPSYVKKWYQTPAANATLPFTKMTLNGELNVLTGVFAYLFYVIVALASVNSIANSFNLSEWRFVQSRLGLCCLSLSLLHDSVMHFRLVNERNVENYSMEFLLTRTKMHSMYVPVFVLVARLVLTHFKPVSGRLRRIRDGSVVKTASQEANVRLKESANTRLV